MEPRYENGKAFTRTKPSDMQQRTTSSVSEQITLAEATMAVLREAGMIRNFILKSQPTKPAIHSSGLEFRESERSVTRVAMSSSPRPGIVENAVLRWLINATRSAHARFPVEVREMMESALRNSRRL
jgi:hypothetical protein